MLSLMIVFVQSRITMRLRGSRRARPQAEQLRTCAHEHVHARARRGAGRGQGQVTAGKEVWTAGQALARPSAQEWRVPRLTALRAMTQNRVALS
jgi:hypothetical protein